jgi:hypothetical protein
MNEVTKPWRPRASGMGAYHACERRAWYDKGIHDGTIPATGDNASSPYADLGSLIHPKAQTILGCTFPNGHQEELGETRDLMRANASQLFKGDMSALDRAVDKGGRWAAACMVGTFGPIGWLAELECEVEAMKGHIDFMSKDGQIIVDLKTTSRKPDHNRMKPGHLIQLLMYYMVSGKKAKYGYILYTDSMSATWSIMSAPVDFQRPVIQDYLQALEQKIDYLRAMDTTAVDITPRPGFHCQGDFCPYTTECRDSIIPPAGHVLFNPDDGSAAPKVKAVNLSTLGASL